MAIWSNLAGTVTGYIRLGLTGPRLKNSAGELAVRNAGDTADAKVQIAAGTAANHAVVMGQLDQFANQAANTVYAGPASGAATAPTFRGIIYPDFAASTFVDVSNSVQAIPADSFTALIFPTETADTLGEYDTTTGTFTPQNTGQYLVWVSVESNTAGVTDQRILISLSTTAGTDGTRILNAYTNSAALLNASAVRPVSMTGGTAYYFNIHCSSAETLSGGIASAMSIKRIG